MPAEAAQLRHWVAAARPVGHGMIAMPLLWGQALALLVTQQLHWQWFVIIHLFGMAIQIYILYLNDYADESIDRQNRSFWLSGGSRVIPDGHLTGRQLYRASFLALLFLLLLSGLGFAMGRTWMPAITGLVIVLGWTYSLAPIKSSYRGYGEVHQALSCGAVLPLLAFYLQAGTLAEFPWWYLLPACLIFFAGNIITALPDVPSDKSGEKLSYPVRHGGEKARRDVLAVLLAAYLLVVVVSTPWLPWRVAGLCIAVPAISLLGYVYQSGLVEKAEATNRALCKRYVLLTSLSQFWVMLLWSILLFAYGLENA